MVLGMAPILPPKLKRVRIPGENLTLSSGEGLDQPILLQKAFPVSDDRTTSGLTKQGRKFLPPFQNTLRFMGRESSANSIKSYWQHFSSLSLSLSLSLSTNRSNSNVTFKLLFGRGFSYLPPKLFYGKKTRKHFTHIGQNFNQYFLKLKN